MIGSVSAHIAYECRQLTELFVLRIERLCAVTLHPVSEHQICEEPRCGFALFFGVCQHLNGFLRYAGISKSLPYGSGIELAYEFLHAAYEHASAFFAKATAQFVYGLFIFTAKCEELLFYILVDPKPAVWSFQVPLTVFNHGCYAAEVLLNQILQFSVA